MHNMTRSRLVWLKPIDAAYVQNLQSCKNYTLASAFVFVVTPDVEKLNVENYG